MRLWRVKQPRGVRVWKSLGAKEGARRLRQIRRGQLSTTEYWVGARGRGKGRRVRSYVPVETRLEAVGLVKP